ncbi:MAG: DNA topoisomerase I, partial [Candidatus Bathyarchaeota archaeon]
MKQLHHNGILVPPRYEGKGLTIKVKGTKILLTPEQEEMALAWAKKVVTTYTEDPIFAKNFHADFSKKLGVSVKPSDVDYSNIVAFIEKERAQTASLSKEARKERTAQRKKHRKFNKEHFGYAWVDGTQMEVANYTSEPSSIFIGRGSHPLRGCWKAGPREEDIELNLSPDAEKPHGNWKAIIWKPDSMWIGRWKDKLSDKMKYVWFSESSIMKQSKDIKKFNKANALRQNISRVQNHIKKNLNANNLKRKKIATVCFLIDKLKIRVGDEKDPDEADTVGASTLRPEHLQFNSDGSVTFNFLGKDSIPHLLKAKLPAQVNRNLKDFATNASSSLFNGVSSRHVSEFLDEIMMGLSAKTFRTYYASKTVMTKLEKTTVKPENLEHTKKYVATIANLEAAKICNHRRTISKTWKSSLDKKKLRLRALNKRAKEAQEKLEVRSRDRDQSFKEKLKK